MKNALEARVSQLKVLRDDLKQVCDQRREKFIGFFNKVSERLPEIYRELTKCEVAATGGHANLLILDKNETPFESQIIFDFCPPGKRHGVDIESLSGGEKTIAALSFVLALAQVKQPPFVVMDEVDAFLD